jgi:ATP-binding cassette subfamily C protein CydD
MVLRVTFMSALALELIATISTAVVAVEIGLRLLCGRIEFQQAFFILLIAPDFYMPLRNLSARYHAGMTGVTAARRIFDLLDAQEPAERVVSKVCLLESAFSSDFNISIKGLSYSYPGMGQHSIRDIDLEIKRGKHYALVGSSGSGKSTLARVLLRFIEPDQGEVLIDGLNMRDWARDDWRMYVGWLPQAPSLFNASLRMNITLGDYRFSSDEINNAVRSAGLASLVEKLPQGLETPLLESGARLSGGELQRVALARLFLRHQALLVMDEPTSHLDPELERSLESAIQVLMQGRTTLTIAHRLPTIERSDEVFFIQDGVIAARGNHLDLVNSSRVYQDFIRGPRGVL